MIKISGFKDQNIKKVESDIFDLIEKKLIEENAILGINVGDHGGAKIASKFKKKIDLSEEEVAAATSSLLFLSSRMLQGTLNQDISFNLTSGKEKIILSILTDNITMITYLNRELAELEGMNYFINSLKRFAALISAIIETSDLTREELFVAIKRAIPNIISLAIITKDGLPIKIQSAMPDSMISALISAIFNISDILLEMNLEYSIIAGDNGSIIIHELDEHRILCIAVPEAEDSKLGIYIAKIKAIIE